MQYTARPSRVLVSVLQRIVAIDTWLHNVHSPAHKLSLQQSHHPLSSDCLCRVSQGMQYTDHPSRILVQVHPTWQELYIDLHTSHHCKLAGSPAHHHLHNDHFCTNSQDKVCIVHPSKDQLEAIDRNLIRTWQQFLGLMARWCLDVLIFSVFFEKRPYLCGLTSTTKTNASFSKWSIFKEAWWPFQSANVKIFESLNCCTYTDLANSTLFRVIMESYPHAQKWTRGTRNGWAFGASTILRQHWPLHCLVCFEFWISNFVVAVAVYSSVYPAFWTYLGILHSSILCDKEFSPKSQKCIWSQALDRTTRGQKTVNRRCFGSGPPFAVNTEKRRRYPVCLFKQSQDDWGKKL